MAGIIKLPLPFGQGVGLSLIFHTTPPVREGGDLAVSGGRPGLEAKLLTVAGQRRTFLTDHRLRL